MHLIKNKYIFLFLLLFTYCTNDSENRIEVNQSGNVKVERVYGLDGKLKKFTRLVDGQKDSLCSYTDESAGKIYQFNYVNGIKNGMYSVFNLDKNQIEFGHFENGIRKSSGEIYSNDYLKNFKIYSENSNSAKTVFEIHYSEKDGGITNFTGNPLKIDHEVNQNKFRAVITTYVPPKITKAKFMVSVRPKGSDKDYDFSVFNISDHFGEIEYEEILSDSGDYELLVVYNLTNLQHTERKDTLVQGVLQHFSILTNSVDSLDLE